MKSMCGAYLRAARISRDTVLGTLEETRTEEGNFNNRSHENLC